MLANFSSLSHIPSTFCLAPAVAITDPDAQICKKLWESVLADWWEAMGLTRSNFNVVAECCLAG